MAQEEDMRTPDHPREKALIPHYDNHPVYYSPVANPNFVTAMLEFAVPRFRLTTRSVLDVGCGNGRLAGNLPEFIHVTGIDYSTVRIELARKQRGDYHCVDIYDFMEKTVSLGLTFDLVVMVEIIEHLEEPIRALNLARRLGPVVGTVPVNLPYVAHLQVYESHDDVVQKLKPHRSARVTNGHEHILCWWPAVGADGLIVGGQYGRP